MIPLPLRVSVFRLLQRPAWQPVGQYGYRWTAKKIARVFSRFPEIAEIGLIRGATRRCVPVVSDLDFILLLKAPLTGMHGAERLLKWKRLYRQAKSLFPILGGFFVLEPAVWRLAQRAPWATTRWFSERCSLLGGTFFPVAEFAFPAPLFSRLALAFHHWNRAFWFASQKRSPHNQTFYEACLRRELGKVLDFSLGRPLQFRREEDVKTLFSESLDRLNSLSETWRHSFRPNPVHSFQLFLNQDPTPDPLRNKLSPQVQKMLSQFYAPLPLTKTAVPFLFQAPTKTFPSFFAQLFSDNPKAGSFPFAFSLMSEAMHEAFSVVGGWTDSLWDGLTREQRQDRKWQSHQLPYWISLTEEQLGKALLSLTSSFLCGDRAQFFSVGKEACTAALSLSREILGDVPRSLDSLPPTVLPATQQFFRDLQRQRPFSSVRETHDWLRAFREMTHFLQNRIAQTAGDS